MFRRRRFATHGAVAVVAALTFAACGSSNDPVASPSDTGSDTVAPAETPAPAAEATDDVAAPGAAPAPVDDQAATDPDTTSAPTDEASDPADVVDEADDAPPAQQSVDVPEALQFTAPLVGGGELDAATLAGAPTVFWFWAPT